MYLNQGNGHFVEGAKALKINDQGNTRGALFVDLDADGDEDLVVANSIWRRRQGVVNVYENLGNEFRLAFHFARKRNNAYRAVVAADVDADGDLDLFVANYGTHGSNLDPKRSMLDDHSGLSDLLLINQGNFKFSEQAKAWGVADDGWTLAAALVDLDKDGRPELIAADDFGQKRLYKNIDGKRFENVSAHSGFDIEKANGMGVDVADYNGDGELDVYFANMHSNAGTRLSYSLPARPELKDRIRRAAGGNTLWLGQGALRFRESGEQLGVADGGWAWSGRFLDMDHYEGPEIVSPCGFISSADQEDG